MAYEPKILNWNDCQWASVRDKMRNMAYQADNMTTTLTEAIPGHTPGPIHTSMSSWYLFYRVNAISMWMGSLII